MKNKDNQTRRAIIDAYVELIKDKYCRKIKVREVADAAFVQRSTFYIYFENIDHLLASLEDELIENMVFYIKPETYDPENVLPLKSIEGWFDYCKENYRYIMALMGENGDPEFERKFKDRVCRDINRMMDDEEMPNDALRPYCVELTYSIHFSVMKFAIQVINEEADFNFDSYELTCLTNNWRSNAIKIENEKGLSQTMKK